MDVLHIIAPGMGIQNGLPTIFEFTRTVSGMEETRRDHDGAAPGGNLNLARGQFEVEESLYQQAVSEDGDRDVAARANLRSSLGVALAQQGRLDDALAAMFESYRLYEQSEAGPSAELLRNIG